MLILLFSECKFFTFFTGNPGKTKPGQTIAFTENKGQVRDQNYVTRPDILFSGTSGDLLYHLRKDGISYQLNRIDKFEEVENKFKTKKSVPAKNTVYRLDIDWLNCNTTSVTHTDKALDGVANYYLEVCPGGVTNVKSYSGVTYKEIYKGIDLHYYQGSEGLKYDYFIAANSNYKQIRLQVRGPKNSTSGWLGGIDDTFRQN